MRNREWLASWEPDTDLVSAQRPYQEEVKKSEHGIVPVSTNAHALRLRGGFSPPMMAEPAELPSTARKLPIANGPEDSRHEAQRQQQ